ncbi:unnamed protein product [Trifolium pratense]|uniref:Uncharacterized protein n=1 Tax=Trifolium pratense TaxID=57577 RepID=A0ACB0JXF3_TRIPR|nr:unnamed protein product [Trifolium pratense]
MAKTLTFAYAVILFLFLFFVARNIDALIPCKNDSDCPDSTYTRTFRCVNKVCRWTRKFRAIG